MKKLLILLVVIFAMTSVNAQVTKPMQKKTVQNKSMTCYVMKDGKMYHSMANKEMLMEKEVTLKNGDKIMPDGMVKMKDGKEMMLKNDECIDAKGNFHKSHMEHHKKA
ncbi:hypothetical protein QG516_25240 [Pedobacter gandavensis]|uniref:DUF6799 domain-containing protein n=1 Tax=Pedobacter TaxID=84567 RepID=UPI001C9968F0|nr:MULTISPECIES: DUF6799 domain-containing protein [Pedobacter]WGQ09822.1 hypothetical protein QG516_25240 [Pedobacter gandavensis]